MLKNIIFLSTIITVSYCLNDADYCHLSSCRNQPHTLCRFRSQAPACNAISVGLTDNEKRRIVDLHNQLRQKVASGRETRGMPGPQPAAANMQLLTWDDEIAEIAQRWANQCKFGHDQCRDSKLSKIGQNVAYRGTTGNVNNIKVEDMVYQWYNEVDNYNAHSVSRFSTLNAANRQQIGHYTQLVWADTNKLGCGAIKYRANGFNRFYLVCNYGPAGNWLGEPVYRT